MTNSLQIAILEAAHDGVLNNHEAIDLINQTYDKPIMEGMNLEARSEYKERTKAAKELVKKYKQCKKDNKLDEADKCLDKAIKILEDLDDSLKEYKDASSFGSFFFGLYAPTIKDFIPIYGYATQVINEIKVIFNAIGKAVKGKSLSMGDFNMYISRLQQYNKQFIQTLKSKKVELKKYKNAVAKESVEDDVTLDDLLAEMTDLV